MPVAYQKDPTFRVVLPSGQQLGYRHCDADYHHPPAEINWWIPLTSVSDSNTLHTESLPGRGDFAPVNLEYGQALRFYGNLCCHYTIPNVSDTCRVSFDMRVLSLDHHDPEWSDRLGRKCLFRVGQYYRIPSSWKYSFFYNIHYWLVLFILLLGTQSMFCSKIICRILSWKILGSFLSGWKLSSGLWLCGGWWLGCSGLCFWSRCPCGIAFL